ncbi:hypothetical protein L0B53_06790 [Vibrio sp. SS-MA-C1-2]|uniref:hypothetical protein n=1 Tax=Vibrio sp. SS-MA-C1-2 TaxID=2908646 RepID=UPI001F293B9F|nr:hypothetical protein [Vibrio sp. SS-MA-C1-2]UJF19274.1 hypothetical protein L0B53_06790 [Vibrio sp. SS-MA-C1-2]
MKTLINTFSRYTGAALVLGSAFSFVQPVMADVNSQVLEAQVTHEIQAPIGLHWGEKKSDLHATRCSVDNFETCAINPDTKLPFAEQYYGVFDKESHELVKVVIFGKDITEDPDGTKGKAEFNQYKNQLIHTYGQPAANFERVGMSVYDDSNQFYQCLKYMDCGYYTAGFGQDQGTVSLVLKGLDAGKGYLKMVYQSTEFYEILDQSS